jgi:predicted flavoprotein YhiN
LELISRSLISRNWTKKVVRKWSKNSRVKLHKKQGGKRFSQARAWKENQRDLIVRARERRSLRKIEEKRDRFVQVQIQNQRSQKISACANTQDFRNERVFKA